MEREEKLKKALTLLNFRPNISLYFRSFVLLTFPLEKTNYTQIKYCENLFHLYTTMRLAISIWLFHQRNNKKNTREGKNIYVHFWFFCPNDVMVIANESRVPIGNCTHLLNRFCFVMQSTVVRLNVHKNREHGVHSQMRNVEEKKKQTNKKLAQAHSELPFLKKDESSTKKALDCFYSKPLLQIPVLIVKTCHFLVPELKVLLYIFTTRFPHTFKM